ncbi:hypothetical protein FB107DRAFT_294210 [Schizophyllum commune]
MGRLRLRLAICGTGLGGLVAAHCLAQYPDIDATVYEGASCLEEVDAGIGFWPRPMEILKPLGLEEELMERSCAEAGKEEDTKFICRRQLRVHRADFHTVLVAHIRKLGRENVVCSKRLSSYSDASSSFDAPSPIFYGFSSSCIASYGTVATCDVLVGADGLKSRVRVGMMERLVFEATRQAAGPAGAEGEAETEALAAAAQPVWSGFVAYRVLISADKLRERAPEHSLLSNPMLYFGKNACIVGYSIQNGACLDVIFFTFDSAQEHDVHPGEWMRKAAKAEFAGAFEGWEPEVQAMLNCVDGALRWAVHTTKPPGLPTFVHGRKALLLGDAAHSMTPFQGSGAGQAVEDAWLLAHLLGYPAVTRDTIPEALRVYDAARRHVAQDVQERSRVNGHLLALNYRGIDFDALQGEAQRAALIELGEQMQRD